MFFPKKQFKKIEQCFKNTVYALSYRCRNVIIRHIFDRYFTQIVLGMIFEEKES